MPIESDAQITARLKREKAVASAWRRFKSTAPRKIRRSLKKLPSTGVYFNDHDAG